ncbi:SDR family NAD(P)-dependent oxidoreductase [Colwellia ponticola]|uniref:Glucose 1-dehydrogenase n=1 Tax=Colwellia ponticola TaxID=2304625 RepID=A0A8H2JP21_9GAMM|nr:glucose 1-dehydrogenase [Colwellia ponticola]TMM46947.1 glucose 1-dehydrogenase [Colwellia ponticola]
MKNSVTLDHKVAIVTGAARGIGKAICQVFVDAGMTVIATDILTQELNEMALALGKAVTPVTHDVTDQKQWQALVDMTLSKHGNIDILVNNAGILLFSTLETTDVEKFRQLIDINLTGTFLGLHSVIPSMKKAGSGAIVNISSASSILPNNGTSAYAASKYAVRGLTRTAALELGPFGIRVNSVHPGAVNTPMTNPQGLSGDALNSRFTFIPQQRGCEPEEVANMVQFLISEKASYCNGAEMVIDGGLTAGQYYYGVPGAPER